MGFKHQDLEGRTFEIGSAIIQEAKQKKRFSFDDQVFDLCMKNPKVKTQLLRFVEVLPSLQKGGDVVSHLDEYLLKANLDLGVLNRVLGLAGVASKLTPSLISQIVNYSAHRMARGFIAGENIKKTAGIVQKLSDGGMEFSLDHLGEKTLCEKDADKYMKSYFDAIDILSQRFGVHSKDQTGKSKINLSVKVSALYSKFDSIDPINTSEIVKGRLRQIFSRAKKVGAFVNLDTEDFVKKDLTGEIFKELLSEKEFKDYNAGMVIQTYLKDSEETLRDLISWGRKNQHLFTIRLVKGAYWDHEVMLAQKNAWDIPVFTEKWQSDANYESLTRILLENQDIVHTAIASHNIRSIAHSLALQEKLCVGGDKFEIQMLYGMGQEIKETLVDQKIPLRIYNPYGDLISGMGYFVRRLLENSANESFLRSFDSKADPKELLKNPLEVGGVSYA